MDYENLSIDWRVSLKIGLFGNEETALWIIIKNQKEFMIKLFTTSLFVWHDKF